MSNTASFSLLFMLTTTIHNIEEGLWLPQWSKHAGKFHKSVEKEEFHFSLIILTVLAYLVSGLYMFFPQGQIIKYFFIGYVGTMIINAIIPHFAATVIMKRYAPGVITAIVLNIPLNSLIVKSVIDNKSVNIYEVILSTGIVAAVLIASLTPLFKLGRKVINF